MSSTNQNPAGFSGVRPEAICHINPPKAPVVPPNAPIVVVPAAAALPAAPAANNPAASSSVAAKTPPIDAAQRPTPAK